MSLHLGCGSHVFSDQSAMFSEPADGPEVVLPRGVPCELRPLKQSGTTQRVTHPLQRSEILVSMIHLANKWTSDLRPLQRSGRLCTYADAPPKDISVQSAKVCVCVVSAGVHG